MYFKNEAINEMDAIILNSIGKDTEYEDFREYSEEMESFTFSDIFE